MSTHPQDEFDDVAPYPPGQAGAHRALTEAPGAKRTGLPWIVLLAVVALAVGGFSYFGLAGGQEDADGEDAAQAEEADDAEGSEDDEGEGEQAGDGEASAEEDAESPSPEESPSPTDEEDEEDGSASDTESPVQVLNYQSSAQAAQNAQAQLEDYGYNVVNVTQWTYQATEVPVVFHPSGQSELAEEIAANMGIERVVQDDQWSSVAVIVDESFAG